MKKKKTVAARSRSTSKKRRIKQQRPVHKRLLLHPVTFFLLLILGVLFLGLTLPGTAADLIVRAKVSAPLPTGAAAITSPGNGASFTTVPIDVSGTCPADGSGSYIQLLRNDIATGAALCQPGNTFTLKTDLFKGANELKVQIYNFTDDAGPAGAPVIINYQPSVPSAPVISPGTTKSQSTAKQDSIAPFFIKTDFQYQGVNIGQLLSYDINIVGGEPPYTITVDWGDNDPTFKIYGPKFSINHRYQTKADRAGGHTITVKITDSLGKTTLMQMFAVIKSPVTPLATVKNTPLAPKPCSVLEPGCIAAQSLSAVKPWMWAVWPTYGVIVLMAASFWLGERQELKLLPAKATISRRKG